MNKERFTAEELLDRYEQGIRYFDYKNLSGEDFQGLYIPGVRFAHSNLNDVNFTGANLEGLSIYECGLISGTIFDGANLTHSDIYRTTATYADFSNADLRYSTFSRMTFDSANFYQANLSFCRTTEQTSFRHCDFSQAILKYANLLEVGFEGSCIFTDVDFEGCLFRYSAEGSNYFNFCKNEDPEDMRYYFVPNISEYCLKKAYILKPYSNLSHADFSQIKCLANEVGTGGLDKLDLSYANLSHANLSLADLSNTHLRNTKLTKIPSISFNNINLNFANLSHTLLLEIYISEGNLKQAQLDFCQIIATSIKDTDFSGSSLRYASFKNSHLRNVSFQDCQFENTDFTNTYIYGDAQIPPEVDLSQAHLLPVDAPYPENPSFH